MQDFIEFDTTPYEEPCAQVGHEDYRQKAREEGNRFITMLKQRFPNIPEKARFSLKWFPHDFGSYAQVVLQYDDSDEKSTAFAFHVEEYLPATWNETEVIPFDLDKMKE